MTNAFIIEGNDPIYARCRANEIALKMAEARVDYSKLEKCNSDDLEKVLRPIKLKDIKRHEIGHLILAHFRTASKIKPEDLDDLETASEDDKDLEDNEEDYFAQDFFKDLEQGEIGRAHV